MACCAHRREAADAAAANAQKHKYVSSLKPVVGIVLKQLIVHGRGQVAAFEQGADTPMIDAGTTAHWLLGILLGPSIQCIGCFWSPMGCDVPDIFGFRP